MTYVICIETYANARIMYSTCGRHWKCSISRLSNKNSIKKLWSSRNEQKKTSERRQIFRLCFFCSISHQSLWHRHIAKPGSVFARSPFLRRCERIKQSMRETNDKHSLCYPCSSGDEYPSYWTYLQWKKNISMDWFKDLVNNITTDINHGTSFV